MILFLKSEARQDKIFLCRKKLIFLIQTNHIKNKTGGFNVNKRYVTGA